MVGITDSKCDMSLGKLQELMMDREDWRKAVYSWDRGKELDTTE